jgi:hypothetical protein
VDVEAKRVAEQGSNDAAVTPQSENKKWWIGCALVAVGLLIWRQGPREVFYAGLPALLALALLLVHRVRPELIDKAAPWLDRAWRVEAALATLIVASVLRINFQLGFLLVAAGIVLLATEGRRRGEVVHLDPASAWRSGWPKRILLISVALAAFSFGNDFEGEFRSTSSSGGYTYTYTDAAADGYESGDAPKVAVLLVPIALWLVWRTNRRPEWYRYVPIASLGLAGLWMMKIAWDDYRFVQELHDIGGGYPRFQAAGPAWFLIALIPGLVVAIRYALRGVEPLPVEEAG